MYDTNFGLVRTDFIRSNAKPCFQLVHQIVAETLASFNARFHIIRYLEFQGSSHYTTSKPKLKVSGRDRAYSRNATLYILE